MPSGVRSPRLRRTVDTWGEDRQNVLSSLRVGVVGVGSVGCIIAETLARIGATDILLVDADRVETHNLDRILYADGSDVGRFKVDLVAEQLKRGATAKHFRVDARRAWIQERDAYHAALDCDVLFAAVDRPLAKDVLNNIALCPLHSCDLRWRPGSDKNGWAIGGCDVERGPSRPEIALPPL